MAGTDERLRRRVAAAHAEAVAEPPANTVGRRKPDSVLTFLQDPTTTKQLARLLGTEEMADRWLRIALTLCRQTPKLLTCTPDSLAGALMTCAQLKLEPGPPLGLAWIIPYDASHKINGTWVKVPEAQFQLGYPGIIQLAMRSGQLADISAQAVCEGDEFGFDYLSGEKHHKPPMRGLRGKAIGFYCHARYANGGEHFLYMSREEMVAHRDRYAASRQFKKGPWYDDADKPETPLFDAQGRKTMVRLSRPYLPASADFVMGLMADERVNRLDKTGRVVIDDDALAGIGVDEYAEVLDAVQEEPVALPPADATVPVAVEAVSPVTPEEDASFVPGDFFGSEDA